MVLGTDIASKFFCGLVSCPGPEDVNFKAIAPKLSTQAASLSVDHAAH
jgi:hypothetical protein